MFPPNTTESRGGFHASFSIQVRSHSGGARSHCGIVREGPTSVTVFDGGIDDVGRAGQVDGAGHCVEQYAIEWLGVGEHRGHDSVH